MTRRAYLFSQIAFTILVSSIAFPAYATVNTGESVTAPEGKETTLSDGTRILVDGTIVRPDGTKMLPNGDVVLPDGTVLKAQTQ